ncbi:MAG: hypothetical protein GX345_04790 [Clostridiales bacterium]|nr:hypothetical protein [Clostridiales bacterium]
MIGVKKAIFIFTSGLLALVTVLIFAYEGFDLAFESSDLSQIKTSQSRQDYEAFKAGKLLDKNTLLKFAQEPAYDQKSDTHYSCHDKVKLKHAKRAQLLCFYDEEINAYKITAVLNDSYQELKLVVTGMPIVKIDRIKERHRPLLRKFKKDYDKVILTAMEMEEGKEAQKYQIKMRRRGDSSWGYPKKVIPLKT